MTEHNVPLWRRIIAVIDDLLPMSAQQRHARDDDGKDHSAARKLRLKLHMLEKRGKGGMR